MSKTGPRAARRWPPTVAAAVILPLALLSAACSPEPDPTAQAQAEAAAEAVAAPSREGMRQAAGQLREYARERAATRQARSGARGDWWEDEDIARRIGLTEAQRDRIAALAGEREARIAGQRADIRAARNAFRKALEAGETERAREEARREAALASEQDLARQLLLVDVLETLEPAQRQRLLEEHGTRILRATTRERRSGWSVQQPAQPPAAAAGG